MQRLLVSVQWMLLTLVSSLSSVAVAQLPKGNPKNLGVDSIKTSENQLYGFSLGRRADGTLECALDRAWLTATYPQLLAELEANAEKNVEELKQLRVERLKVWITERNKDEHTRLRLYLEGELERLEAYQAEVEKSEFVLLSIEPAKLVRWTPAKPEQRHIAGVAYKHDLKDVTITATAILERKLKELGVDPKRETFDLSNKLPKLARESDKQWAMRQALVEYDVFEPVELQGKGNFLMGAKDRPDPLALLKEMQSMQGFDILGELSKEMRLDLGTQLAVPEKQQWRQVAIDKAEKKGARGVLVLQLQQDMLSTNAKVVATFLAKGADGTWFDAYRREHENDGSQADKDELERIKQDPTIQRILPMIEAIGGAPQIERALRQGAATGLALSQARATFGDYKSAYSRDILSPPPPEPNIK